MDVGTVSNAQTANIITTQRQLPAPQVDGRNAAEKTVAAAATGNLTPEPSNAQVRQAVESINRVLKTQSQNIVISFEADREQPVIQVIDQETKEVLRQIPNVETIEIAKFLDQALKGLLIRQQA